MKHTLFPIHKYQEGQVVFALDHPGTPLIIRRYIDRIYYCQLQEKPISKDLVYFENELFPAIKLN